MNKQKALFQQEFLKSSVKLAVKIETVDDFRLNNNLGLIRASADLQINGTLAQPKVNGRIHVQGGSRVYFLGRRYDVETGTIDFYGTTKLLPVLNITMTTLVQDYSGNNFYEITLPIVGPLDKLEYRNPRSVPSLTDDQIYSLLLTGSTAGTQGAQSPAVLFQKELVAFMSGQVFFGVEDTFARTFGLTRVDVQQNLLTTGDNAGAKLIVGKDIGSAFSLTYSFPLNDTNKQTWITSYRYKRNYIFRAIRQEDNSYTISGRHTVLFGKGTAYSYISKGEEKKILEPRIASMKIENDSPISNEEVRKKIKLAEGDLYDYWKLQDNLEELEKTFQDKGYLFPRAEVNEQDFDNNTVALTIQVSAGLPRTMSFEGMKIKGKQLDQYKKWWREGLSENLVISLIQQDLLRSLWLDGYHQASVIQTTSTNNNVIDYHFEISPGIKFTVAEIKFQGNKLINSDDLTKGILVFYESHNEMISEAIHDFAKFKQKVEAAYIQKGLLLSKPEPGPLSSEPKSGKIVRQVFIQEGPYSKIAEVHVEGGPSFPPQLAGQLKVKQGDVVDLEVLPDNEAIIQDFYETQGYRSFSIQTILKRKPNTSDLILTYDETVGVRSIIASIEIRGNEVTRTSLIESRLNLKPGDVLTDQKIAEAQKRLYELGVFQQVKMETEPSEKAGELDLIVYCVEGKQYELQYGPRYNSDGGIGAEVSLVNYNLFGHAQRGSFYGRYDGNRPVYRFDYWVPNLSGFWSNTLFSLYYQVQEDLITRNFQNSPDFTLRTAIGAFQVQQDRRLKGFLRILYGFAAGTSTVKPDVVTGTDNSVTGTFVDFSTSLYIDTRDDPLNAKRGQFLSLDGSAAPKIGTDIQFTRAYAQYFLYKRVGRVIWASGVRAGFLKTFSDEFTLDERFQAGGGTTVRGFRTDDLTPKDTDAIGFLFGGDAVFILNQEIRFPIHKWLGGAVFYDAGNVYRFLRDFNPLDLRNTGGFGLRIDNPYVILRFDVGFNFNPMNDEPRVVFHFGIGQAF